MRRVSTYICGNGGPGDEFNPSIWHWVFGWVNRILAEQDFFYDLTREREQEARYVAWVAPVGIEPK